MARFIGSLFTARLGLYAPLALTTYIPDTKGLRSASHLFVVTKAVALH